MKNEFLYLIVFGVISFLAVGLMTEFEFADVEIQMHDVYFIVGPVKSVIFLTLILWTIRNCILLVDLMTERYQLFALLVAIINPLVGLFLLLLVYYNIEFTMTLKSMHPNNSMVTQVVLICFLIGLLVVLAIIEIRMVVKLRGLMRNTLS